MIVPFATNQVLIAESPSNLTVTITTDPVPLGEADRAAPMANVHAIWGPSTANLGFQAQISNDGQHWANVGSPDDFDSSGSGQKGTTVATTGKYIRYSFNFVITGSGMGVVIFDAYVRLFKL